MYEHVNPNPNNFYIDDCVVRAIAIATGHSWDYTFLSLSIHAFDMKGMSSTNFVWDDYLRDIGFQRYDFFDDEDMTVAEFCREYKDGRYILATGSHVVAVIDGTYYDTWDSGRERIKTIYERRTMDDISSTNAN